MITIDEAIANHKKLKVSAESNNDMRGAFYSAKEHEQLAEWLEELKALRNGLKIKCDSLNEALEKCKKIGYNKALDDFVKFASDMLTVEEEDGTIRPMWLEEMAEKLKAGVENEN